MTPRRIGVMGGTFDPVHHVHLSAANDGAALFHLDEVVFVPTVLGWHNAEQLFAKAHFVGVSRPGYDAVDLAGFPEGAVTLVEVPALAISSTDCRARVARGSQVWYLVPDGVVQYIEKRRLYRDQPHRRRADDGDRPSLDPPPDDGPSPGGQPGGRSGNGSAPRP